MLRALAWAWPWAARWGSSPSHEWRKGPRACQREACYPRCGRSVFVSGPKVPPAVGIRAPGLAGLEASRARRLVSRSVGPQEAGAGQGAWLIALCLGVLLWGQLPGPRRRRRRPRGACYCALPPLLSLLNGPCCHPLLEGPLPCGASPARPVFSMEQLRLSCTPPRPPPPPQPPHSGDAQPHRLLHCALNTHTPSSRKPPFTSSS